MEKIPSHGGNYYFYKKKVKYDFSININPLGIPEDLKHIFFSKFHELEKYPEIYAESLIDKLSENFRCSVNNLIVANGSIQIIYLIPYALRLKRALIVIPNFSEYEKSLKMNNCKMIFYRLMEEDNFYLDISKFLNFLKKADCDSVFITNPSNPCGNVIEFGKLKEIANYCRRNDKYLIIDEAFIDFTFEKSLIELNYKKLIILRSFTKIFAIPGLRLGFAKSDRDTISKIRKFLPPWSLNSFSIEAGKFLLDKKDYLNLTKKFVKNEREKLVEELREIKEIKIFPSETNYLLIKILDDFNVFQLSEFMLNHGILIRNCANYRGLNDEFFRICVKKENENKIFITKFREYVENLYRDTNINTRLKVEGGRL